MILTAHQPAYLPWLGLFHKIALSDIFVILDQVQFEKNSFINRNKIKTRQGPLWLTIPVLQSNHFKKMLCEIEIDNKIDWKKKHWKSIYLNYKQTMFFDRYSSFFECCYKQEWTMLSELLLYILNFFIAELGIKTKVLKQSSLSVDGKKDQLILNLCKDFRSNIFVSGILGKNYLRQDVFQNCGINIFFQDYSHPGYNQLKVDEFLPYMSIIDLLFNEGPHSFDILMSGNVSKEFLIKEFL